MKMFFSEKEGFIMVDMRKVDRSTKNVKQRKEVSDYPKISGQIEVPGIHYPDPVGKGEMT